MMAGEGNLLDDKGYTPLHIAAAECDADRVSVLISEGSDVNLYSSSGLLPLHCVFLGLEPGAEPKEGHNMGTKDNTSIVKILELLVKNGCDLNAETRAGEHVTARKSYWQCDSRIHLWMLEQQPVLLPDFRALVEAEGVLYRLCREHMAAYLRAGSRDPLAVQHCAASALLGDRPQEYSLAFRSAPYTVRAISPAFLFQSGWHENKLILDDCLAYYIGFIYRVCGDGGPWAHSEKDLAPDHLYWRHQRNKRNPLTLLLASADVIRHTLLLATRGRSILPVVPLLPLPTSLKDVLTLDSDIPDTVK